MRPAAFQASAQLIALASALFANAFAMANPFPYSPFLVIHYGLTDDERALGFYAGFVISAFMIGRCFASYPLGVLSDQWGRRPVIEVGLLLSCGFFQLAFAVSSTFGACLTFRFLMGFTNGIVGVAKAWLPELAPPSRQACAMSMISGMWGIGQVVGPGVGGLLYYGLAAASTNQSHVANESTHVATNASAVDSDSRGTLLLEHFPQFLPNALGVVIALGSCVAVRVLLPIGDSGLQPSVAHLRRRGRRADGDGTVLVSDDSAKSAANELVSAEDDHAGERGGEGRGEDGGPEGGAEGGAEGLPPRRGSRRAVSSWGVPRTSFAPLLVYCMLSGFTIMYAEAYPLWLIAPRESGGLGWTAAQVGALLSTSGAFVAISNFVIFPCASAWLPATTLFRVCLATFTLISVVTPSIASLGSVAPSALLPVLLLHCFVKELTCATCFTAVFLIINNSCHREHRGRVNGCGMAFSSAFKAVGPAFGAISFAWSLTNGRAAPFDVHFTFLVVSLLAALTLAISQVSFSARNDVPLEDTPEADVWGESVAEAQAEIEAEAEAEAEVETSSRR